MTLLAGDYAVGPHQASLELLEIVEVELADFLVVSDRVLGVESKPQGVG